MSAAGKKRFNDGEAAASGVEAVVGAFKGAFDPKVERQVVWWTKSDFERRALKPLSVGVAEEVFALKS